MATTALALGRLFDIAPVIVPVNLNTGANTGMRINMANAEGITFVIFAGVGTAASDLAVDLQEATAYTGGTIQDLDIITTYYTKDELALEGDEPWLEVTQVVASEIADIGALGTSAENQQIAVIEVLATQLSDGYSWISLNAPQPGATKTGCVMAILWGLKAARKPASLGNLLNPGSANV